MSLRHRRGFDADRESRWFRLPGLPETLAAIAIVAAVAIVILRGTGRETAPADNPELAAALATSTSPPGNQGDLDHSPAEAPAGVAQEDSAYPGAYPPPRSEPIRDLDFEQEGMIDPAAHSAPYMPDADFVLGGPAFAVDIVGDVAFVAVGAHLVAYDIRADDAPRLLGASPPLPGDTFDVLVRDGYAFVAVQQTLWLPESPGGLYVLDVRDTRAMPVVARVLLEHRAQMLRLDGDRLLVTVAFEAGFGSLMSGPGGTVVDVSNPRAPTVMDGVAGAMGEEAFVGSDVFGCYYDLHSVSIWPGSDGRDLEHVVSDCTSVARLGDERRIVVTREEWPGPHEMATVLEIFDVDPAGDLDHVTSIALAPLDGRLADFLAVMMRSRDGYLRLIDELGTVLTLDLRNLNAPVVVSIVDVGGTMHVRDMDGTEDTLIVVGATRGPNEEPIDILDEVQHLQRGSEIALWRTGSAGPTDAVRVSGPGTLVSGLAVAEERAVLIDSSGDRDSGRLWLIDLTPTYPRILDVRPFNDADTFNWDGISKVDGGLWFASAASGPITAWSIDEGLIGAAIHMAPQGPFAVAEGLLVSVETERLMVWKLDGSTTEQPSSTLARETRWGGWVELQGSRVWSAALDTEEDESPHVSVHDLLEPAQPNPLADIVLTDWPTRYVSSMAVIEDRIVLGADRFFLQGLRFNAAAGTLESIWRWREEDEMDTSWALYHDRLFTVGEHVWMLVGPKDPAFRLSQLSLMAIDAHSAPDPAPELMRLPSGVRARLMPEFMESSGFWQLDQHRGRLVGTVMQGGFFGLATAEGWAAFRSTH